MPQDYHQGTDHWSTFTLDIRPASVNQSFLQYKNSVIIIQFIREFKNSEFTPVFPTKDTMTGV